ncbi:MAG: imidazole glycerol phosphate synthase subunit HisH [Candidatus Altiarchaeota archaeon]|nr:imidazole glycerol phosphate synthase subunit HisH [Candidatus Altiarchaeota archaeon]
MIAIIDYGMGNLYSIRNAFLKVGAKAEIVKEPAALKDADAIVLPGVGAFDSAMRNLAPLKDDIIDTVGSGTPFMGICLGMQVLFEGSEEGTEKGLSVLSGRVVRLPETVLIPQMGWNELEIKKSIDLLDGISEGDFFYFVHSYYCEPKDAPVVVASVEYGTDLTAVVAQDNIFGLQFHPEKSGPKGLAILENFTGCVRC